MPLTADQRQLVYESYVRSQGDLSPHEMLRKLLNFVLTKTPSEVKAEMRRVVQENRDAQQARHDEADTVNESFKASIVGLIADLDATDAELV